jgi:hypothetical protein
MTALFAYSKEEAGEVTAHVYTEPVLCIQAVVRHGEEVFLDAVISDEDCGLTTVDDVLAETTNLVGTVVPTPWPPEEDENRLKIWWTG